MGGAVTKILGFANRQGYKGDYIAAQHCEGFDYIDLALIVPQERKPGTLEQIVHDLEAELYSADSAERNE